MRLPPFPPVEEKSWRSPLRVALWTSVVGGLATFAAITAGRALDTRVQNTSQVLLSARKTRRATIGRRLSVSLMLDTPGRQMASEESLRALKLRIPRDFFRDFQLISLQPQPDSVETRGGALYFSYRAVPAGTHPRLLLLPLRAGNFALEMKLFSDNRFQNQCRIALAIAPREGASVPVSPIAAPPQSRSFQSRETAGTLG